MMKPIFQVGPKERLIRSLIGLEPTRQWGTKLATLFCDPASSMAREFTVLFQGFIYRGHTNNQIDWSVYFQKNFVQAEASLVQSVGNYVRRRKQPYVCMDVGAKVGHCTLGMARFADAVTAIEAMPGAYARLVEKTDFNLLKHVKTFQLALDEEDGNVEFEILSPRDHIGVRKQNTLTRGAYGTKAIVAMRGDEVIKKNDLLLPQFLRVDVGDDTMRALRGLSETFHDARPVTLIVCPHLSTGQAIDTDGLRSVLYDDVDFFTFDDSGYDGTYSLEPYNQHARKIVCIPKEIVRVAEHEGCKYRSQRQTSS